MRWFTKGRERDEAAPAGATGAAGGPSLPTGLEITDEFARALSILDAGGHMFLTGKAGTGKSTLIRHFMATTHKAVVVAAPTGIAALNVAGYTLHRLFGFRPTTTLAEVTAGDYRPGALAKVLKSLDTLIVDEASMVRADLFDMIAAALGRFGPHPNLPFGGVQLVLVGDLYQLPPVVQEAETEHFTTRYATPYFFSADCFDRDAFPTVALTRIFRQAGDRALTGILNSLREGLLLKDAQAALNRRTDPTFTPPQDQFWLTLAPTNRIVTARNRQRLDALPGEEAVARASESGELGAFERPVEAELHFKVGAQVMMLNNDPGDRWVNGSLGRVERIDRDGDGSITGVGIVLSDETEVDVFRHTWEVTRPVVDGRVLRHEVVGTFTQLPFKLAWAITIHKSQGQTLDRLIVDLTGGAFAFGQVYVALSRCTSLAGLVLTRPVLAKDLQTDRRVLRYLRETTATGAPVRRCALAVLTVGDEGRLSRPRPVEIAVAFDDGTAISTLVNPQRDLADARSAYGITAKDVLLAPTLAEAWATIAPVIEGAAPVGFGTDLALGLIDFELKRLGVVTPLPLGMDLSDAVLTTAEQTAIRAPSAMGRARAALAVARRNQTGQRTASAFEPPADAEAAAGYLLTRDQDSAAPSSVATPLLTALLTTSATLSSVILRGATADELSRTAAAGCDPALQALICARLASAIRNTAGLPQELKIRIGQLESLYGIDVWAEVARDGLAINASSIDDALVPQTRVCFTGSVLDPSGAAVTKTELEALVLRAGLRWAANVSKTRCDVLIVAEIGSQSGKARSAKQYGKPVFSAADFYAWLLRRAVT